MKVIEHPNKNYDGKAFDNLTFSMKELDVIYNSVIRDSTYAPGFYLPDRWKHIDSKSYKQQMVDLKEELSIRYFCKNQQTISLHILH